MKIDILIKSFNRPYYLERSIRSIYKHANGFKTIKILDDGTPEKYLNKIKKMFPEVEILLSNYYDEKSLKVSSGIKTSGMKIPVHLWREAVQNSTEYLLMIEDDVWFTTNIDLDELTENMAKFNCYLLKLGGLNYKCKEGFSEESINQYFSNIYSDKIFKGNRFLMDLVINNKYKFYSILCRLGLANNQLLPHYYNYLTIPFGLYRKEFWLYTWQDNQDIAKEILLMKNAVAFVNKNKNNRNLVCKMNYEVLKTTYSISSTPDYHKYSIDFNLLKLNNDLNQAWHEDKFDALHNFPNDFSLEYLSKFITKDDTDYNVELFNQWSNVFTNRYLGINKNEKL